jgi:hypothetical protein
MQIPAAKLPRLMMRRDRISPDERISYFSHWNKDIEDEAWRIKPSRLTTSLENTVIHSPAMYLPKDLRMLLRHSESTMSYTVSKSLTHKSLHFSAVKTAIGLGISMGLSTRDT